MVDQKKSSKPMFYMGIAFIVVSAILLLGGFIGESTFPAILGCMGVIFIATSNVRVLK